MDENLIESLSLLGLSPYEARAYCTLLLESPLNAYEISKHCGIPTSKIYETLQRLMTKGCVLVYRSDPIVYGAVPVDDMVERIRLRFTRAADDVTLALKNIPRPRETGLTWSFDGAGNLVESIEQTVRRARTQVFAALWDEELGQLGPSLREAAKRGVELQVAIYGDYELGAPNAYDLTLCGISAEERLNGRRLSVAVIDRAETIVAEFGGGADQGIWTRNPVIALLATEYIREEIMGRVLINELGEARYQALRASRPEIVAMLRREAASPPQPSEARHIPMDHPPYSRSRRRNRAADRRR